MPQIIPAVVAAISYVGTATAAVVTGTATLAQIATVAAVGIGAGVGSMAVSKALTPEIGSQGAAVRWEATRARGFSIRGNVFNGAADLARVLFVETDCERVAVNDNDIEGFLQAVIVQGTSTLEVAFNDNRLLNQKDRSINAVSGIPAGEFEAIGNRVRMQAGFAANAAYIAANLVPGMIFQRNRLYIEVASTTNAVNLMNGCVATDNTIRAPNCLRAANASGGTSGIYFMRNFHLGAVNNGGGAGNTFDSNVALAA